VTGYQVMCQIAQILCQVTSYSDLNQLAHVAHQYVCVIHPVVVRGLNQVVHVLYRIAIDIYQVVRVTFPVVVRGLSQVVHVLYRVVRSFGAFFTTENISNIQNIVRRIVRSVNRHQLIVLMT
jgi:molybdate-binding protein